MLLHRDVERSSMDGLGHTNHRSNSQCRGTMARLPMSSNISPQARKRLDASAIASREAGLHKDLSRSQLIMIGLGGAIGTGLFMGSGLAIGYAGPAVIVSYAIAAIAAGALFFSFSEMSRTAPASRSRDGSIP